MTVQPKPVQKSLPPIWFGGRSEPALRRTAKIGDGWLVSQATPEEAGVGVKKIKSMASEFGNDIEDDHYGAIFSYCFADSRGEAEALATPYLLRRRDDINPNEMNAFGRPEDLILMLDRYISSGVTKFALRPACPPEMTQQQMEILGKDVIPRYHN